MNYNQNNQSFNWNRPKTRKRNGASVRKKIKWSDLFLQMIAYVRFWSSLCMIVALLSLPYLGYQYISDNNPFPIKHINFVGKVEHLTPERLKEFSRRAFEQNFLTFDLTEFKRTKTGSMVLFFVFKKTMA